VQGRSLPRVVEPHHNDRLVAERVARQRDWLYVGTPRGDIGPECGFRILARHLIGCYSLAHGLSHLLKLMRCNSGIDGGGDKTAECENGGEPLRD
jgi:hypothetical protein